MISLFRDHGCPECNRHGGKTEAEVRRVIERVTGWRFSKAKPAWLQGRNGRRLELDGYNPRHRVAFEYQGEEHYKPIYGADALAAHRRRDERKRLACYRRGVLLIRVPFWKKNIEQFVRDKLGDQK